MTALTLRQRHQRQKKEMEKGMKENEHTVTPWAISSCRKCGIWCLILRKIPVLNCDSFFTLGSIACSEDDYNGISAAEWKTKSKTILMSNYYHCESIIKQSPLHACTMEKFSFKGMNKTRCIEDDNILSKSPWYWIKDNQLCYWIH